MNENSPSDPVFDRAPGNTSNEEEWKSLERERLEKIKALLPQYMGEQREKKRTEQFYPYLLVRSFPGDRGDRPFNNIPFWESPDIWTAVGDPTTTPEIPPTAGGRVVAGQPNTLYAHVWNLGRAPILGVIVEFYWFNPSLGINDASANRIGHARVDLGPRSSNTCHKLVKCPVAWWPLFENEGHECLVVRVSSVGDSVSAGHPWDPWADRHVAQRNITVVQPGTNIAPLVGSLEISRSLTARVLLMQVGVEDQIAVKLVTPHLQLNPEIRTHLLAELQPDGSIILPPTNEQLPGGQLPLNPVPRIGEIGEIQLPTIPPALPLEVARMPMQKLFRFGEAEPVQRAAVRRRAFRDESGGIKILRDGGNISLLLQHEDLLSTSLRRSVLNIPEPQPDQTQVLRMASYEGDQLTGGYTIIVGAVP